MRYKIIACTLCVLLVLTGCRNWLPASDIQKTTKPADIIEIPLTSDVTVPINRDLFSMTVDEIDSKFTKRAAVATHLIQTYNIEDGYLLLSYGGRNTLTKAAVYDRNWNLLQSMGFTPIDFKMFRALDFLGKPFTEVEEAFGECFIAGSGTKYYISTNNKIIVFSLDGSDKDSLVCIVKEADFTQEYQEAGNQTLWLTKHMSSPLAYLDLNTYHLEELQGYFGRPDELRCIGEEEIEESLYKIRMFRSNEGTYYAAYETKEGGVYYVFWQRTKDGDWQTDATYYLGDPDYHTDFPNIVPGASTFTDVLIHDPWAELRTEEDGTTYSYSIVGLGQLLRISYEEDDGIFVVRSTEIVDAESTNTRIGNIVEEDYPEEWSCK